MYYCENCGNIYNTTSNIIQTGGQNININKIIENILSGNIPENIKTINKQKIIESKEFLDLNKNDKDKILDVFKGNNKKIKSKKINLYFICNYCGNTKEIEPKTKILSKTFNKIESKKNKINEDIIYDTIKPRTRNYICPNPKCESQKNYEKREAIFYRNDNTYKITYICTACKAIFSQ